MARPAPATVDELGLQGCLYLWSLLTAQERRLPVAPTKRMTLIAMAVLQENGVIEVPWPEAQWNLKPDAMTTPIEGLQWRLTWEVYIPALLTVALEDYFATIEHDEFSMVVRLRLWKDLGSAESERFFENQLLKNRLPGDWAQDMTFAYRESNSVLTLAQWRYCAWAAVRRGASLAMQQGPQAGGLRDAIYQELRRRASAVASGTWTGCSFPPHSPIPESALARGYVQHLTNLGPLYWTGWPSVEVLLGSRLAHAQG